ncbi:MAG: hypothetical protein OEM66_07765 [Acidimicrobiia bacterium]|nr:hypothetical protein [Acidimicrobiia bacterium]
MLVDLTEMVDAVSLPDFDLAVLRLWMDIEEDSFGFQEAVYPAQGVHDALRG